MTTARIAGIDLGDKWSSVCVLGGTPEAEVEEESRIRTTREGLERWLGCREPMVVVIEVGTHSRWVSEVIKEKGHAVLVANARHLRMIYARDTKTDRGDAEILARVGRVDPNLLHPVNHRSGENQKDLAILKARNTLVECRTKLINHVRGVVKSFGERLPGCSGETFHQDKVREMIPEELKVALHPLVDQIGCINAMIRRYDEDLEFIVNQRYPIAKRLQTVPGVGPVTSMAFVLTIDDPSRFEKSRDVGPFLGLVPRTDQSGNQDPELRITKAGDVLLRKLLVQCAHHILGPFGGESDLRSWGLRLAERGAKRAKKQAVVAVARKLAVLLLAMWRSGEDFVPVRQERSKRPEPQLTAFAG